MSGGDIVIRPAGAGDMDAMMAILAEAAAGIEFLGAAVYSPEADEATTSVTARLFRCA